MKTPNRISISQVIRVLIGIALCFASLFALLYFVAATGIMRLSLRFEGVVRDVGWCESAVTLNKISDGIFCWDECYTFCTPADQAAFEKNHMNPTVYAIAHLTDVGPADTSEGKFCCLTFMQNGWVVASVCRPIADVGFDIRLTGSSVKWEDRARFDVDTSSGVMCLTEQV